MAYLSKFDPTLNDWRNNTNTMNTKHTPGPWEATTMDDMNQCGLGVSAKNPAGMRVNVANVVFNGHNLPTEANARLIAAAPCLLAFAQKVSDGGHDMADLMTEARSVIAKATGNTNL